MPSGSKEWLDVLDGLDVMVIGGSTVPVHSSAWGVGDTVLLGATTFLQGPYDSGGTRSIGGRSVGLMNDDLRVGGYLPLTEPYTDAGYGHTGGGGGGEHRSGRARGDR